MISKVKRSVVIKSRNKPPRKIKSAILSYKLLLCVFDLNDKKENRQLPINKIMATKVISSMIVFLSMLNNLSEVRRIKHMPNKLEAAERI